MDSNLRSSWKLSSIRRIGCRFATSVVRYVPTMRVGVRARRRTIYSSASIETSAACKSSSSTIKGFPSDMRIRVPASSSKIRVRSSGFLSSTVPVMVSPLTADPISWIWRSMGNKETRSVARSEKSREGLLAVLVRKNSWIASQNPW